MADYDIVHVEDNLDISEFVEESSQREGLTYKSFSTLDELEAAVEDTSGNVWVIDGRFPKTEGDIIENNSAEAVKLVRKHYTDARIVSYSGEMDGEERAKKLGIEYFDKADFTAGKLVKSLRAMLQ